MNKSPPLKAIQYFSTTARHLSFSKAAEELCVTQSAVSHQVKLLEEFFNKKLLIRQGKRISLTQEGDDLNSVVRDSLQRIETVSNHILKEPETHLKIIAQTSIATEWLAPRISSFKQSFPDISCYLTMESMAASFDAQEFDIVIGTWPTPDNFVSTKLRDEYWFPVCAPSLSTKINANQSASILTLPLYSSENGEDWQLWMQRQQLRRPAITKVEHFGLALLATKAALSGQGVALSNRFLAEDLIKQGKLVSFPQWQYQLPWGQYHVHYRQGSHYSNAVQYFVEWLQLQISSDRKSQC